MTRTVEPVMGFCWGYLIDTALAPTFVRPVPARPQGVEIRSRGPDREYPDWTFATDLTPNHFVKTS